MFAIPLASRSALSLFEISLKTTSGPVRPDTETLLSQKRIISMPDSAQALALSFLCWLSDSYMFVLDNEANETASVANTNKNIIEMMSTAPLRAGEYLFLEGIIFP